jgi:hypothetical protein
LLISVRTVTFLNLRFVSACIIVQFK